jgi:hypothetical protein
VGPGQRFLPFHHPTNPPHQSTHPTHLKLPTHPLYYTALHLQEGAKKNYARDWDVNAIMWGVKHYNFKYVLNVDDDAMLCSQVSGAYGT